MTSEHGPCAIFWFRRDLRTEDNHGLWQAARSGLRLLPLFIFDRDILDGLPRNDARVEYIVNAVHALNEEFGGRLHVHFGRPKEVFARLLAEHKISAVFTNEDYEPYARARDAEIARLVKDNGGEFHAFKDQVIFGPSEVLKDDDSPYKVYGAYARRWRARLKENPPKATASKRAVAEAAIVPGGRALGLKDIGFQPSGLDFPKREIKKSVLANYGKLRDQLGIAGTSRLGVHLRFGTLSIRKLLSAALAASDTYTGELIWREFFTQVLWHFPYTVNSCFDSRYDKIHWVNDKEQFRAWCEGRTGYPAVDAGMRELNATGFMHNRARMITASFLTKHLLINWTWGERYFAEKLLDFELASNVGNWQWAAGCGCDAAPYFRVFNPALQAKKFDAQGEYVARWVPEIGTGRYPEPIIDHEFARRRVIQVYGKAVKGKL